MQEIIEVTNGLIIDYKAREWCKLPYPNHPNGCPNYNKKYCCPPQAPLIEKWLEGYSRLWFVCIPFNLKEQVERMLLKHSNWTLRQARCLLYWQPKVNKELESTTWDFAPDRLNGVTYCPEAMGVNVIRTAKNFNLPIETKPQRIVYKIALVAGHYGR